MIKYFKVFLVAIKITTKILLGTKKKMSQLTKICYKQVHYSSDLFCVLRYIVFELRNTIINQKATNMDLAVLARGCAPVPDAAATLRGFEI